MKIKVNIARSNETKTVTVDKDYKISDLLKDLEVKPDSTIIMINKKPVPIDSLLEDGQELTLIEVSSGG